MMRAIVFLLAGMLGVARSEAADVLIVADEIPAMQVLAAKLKAEEQRTATIVTQKDLPASLKPFSAVVVYIHRNLDPAAERAFIDYTRAGGKLVPLHHSISSGKRKNQDWFALLGVTLPLGDVSQGGYKWIEPATLELINLAPDHFITTNKIAYPAAPRYPIPVAGGITRLAQGFTLRDSEVYLNHVLAEPRAPLLAFRYVEPKTGKVYQQPTAGWVRAAGEGWIVYFMPGHTVAEFEDPIYSRLVLNAIVWRPPER
jgi:hypothetical protein